MGKEKEKVGTIDEEGIRRQMGLGAKKKKRREKGIERRKGGTGRTTFRPYLYSSCTFGQPPSLSFSRVIVRAAELERWGLVRATPPSLGPPAARGGSLAARTDVRSRMLPPGVQGKKWKGSLSSSHTCLWRPRASSLLSGGRRPLSFSPPLPARHFLLLILPLPPPPVRSG